MRPTNRIGPYMVTGDEGTGYRLLGPNGFVGVFSHHLEALDVKRTLTAATVAKNRILTVEEEHNAYVEGHFGIDAAERDTIVRCPVCGLPDNCGDCNHNGTPHYRGEDA